VLVVAATLVALLVAAPAGAAPDPKAPVQKHTKADMKLAGSVALSRSDLAAGWTKVPPQKPPPPCSIEPDESKLVETGTADPTFLWSDNFTQIGSQVDIFRTAAQARRDWKLTTLALLRGCLLENARHAFGKKVTVRLHSARMLKAPGLGERSLHVRLELDLIQKSGAKPHTVRLVSELVGIGVGRISVVLHAITTKAPLPAAAVSSLTKALATRLTAKTSQPGGI